MTIGTRLGWWTTHKVSIAVALALSTACRSKVAEPASRESPSAPVASGSIASTARATPCTLSVWTDLTAAREQPGMQAAREQILGGLNAGTLALTRASGLDLEQMSREARLCELPGKGHPNRVLEFRGSFPPDLIDKVARLSPGVAPQTTEPPGILRVSSGWLGAKGDRLVWSDDRAALDRGLEDELFDSPPRHEKLFSMRMSRERVNAHPGASRGGPLEKVSWSSVIVSTAKDGKSSEIRFNTDSPENATSLLSSMRAFLDETREKSKLSKVLAPAGLTAEADESSVAIRAQLPLNEVLQLFTRLEQIGKHRA